MDYTVCSSCVYYRQHYTFDERRIFRVYCGHCTFQKAKKKLPDAKACANYVKGDPIEASFVSREYISKALLEYVVKLELLPEIQDEESY